MHTPLRLIRLVALLGLSMVLVACTTPVAGKWRNVQRDGHRLPKSQQLTMTFEPFGQITVAQADGSHTPIGSYTVEGNELTLQSEKETVKYRYEMTDKTLRLQSERRRNEYLLFVREGGPWD